MMSLVHKKKVKRSRHGIWVRKHQTLEGYYDSLNYDRVAGRITEVHTSGQERIHYTGCIIEFPRNFSWNGSSLPSIGPWSLNNPFDYVLSSMVHDRLYETHLLTRYQADLAYYRFMLWEGAPKWQAALRFIALRIGGNKAWQG